MASRTDRVDATSQDESRPTATAHDRAELDSVFTFVKSLAAELSRGHVDLPSPPDVTRRVQRALDADDLSSTVLTRVIGADAGLAARFLTSTRGQFARDRANGSVLDLKLAVTRVGPDEVRSAALPYVLDKLRSAHAHEHIRFELERLWARSVVVAAVSRVLARRTGAARPDVALLAGLLHNVGAVYLLARMDRNASLFMNPRIRDLLMHDWQASIGKAIAQNWGLPDEIADAIGEQLEPDRHEAGARDLADVLCVAVRAADYSQHPDELEIALGSLPRFQRLGLGQQGLRMAMLEAAQDVELLRASLGL